MTVPAIHVTPCRAQPDLTRTQREEPRWCFLCRRRLAGTHILYVEPPGSYYDHFWVYECDGCGEDHHHFPGCGPL